jgi:hypothetical protein
MAAECKSSGLEPPPTQPVVSPDGDTFLYINHPAFSHQDQHHFVTTMTKLRAQAATSDRTIQCFIRQLLMLAAGTLKTMAIPTPSPFLVRRELYQWAHTQASRLIPQQYLAHADGHLIEPMEFQDHIWQHFEFDIAEYLDHAQLEYGDRRAAAAVAAVAPVAPPAPSYASAVRNAFSAPAPTSVGSSTIASSSAPPMPPSVGKPARRDSAPPSKQVRCEGVATYFSKATSSQIDLAKPFAENQTQYLAFLQSLALSRDALKDATYYQVPSQDIVIISFASIDHAKQFLAGKASKLRACKGIHINFNRKYARTPENRLRQIIRRFERLTGQSAPPTATSAGPPAPTSSVAASEVSSVAPMEGVETHRKRDRSLSSAQSDGRPPVRRPAQSPPQESVGDGVELDAASPTSA